MMNDLGFAQTLRNVGFAQEGLDERVMILQQLGFLGLLPCSAIEIRDRNSYIKVINTPLSGVDYEICPILKQIDGIGFVGRSSFGNHKGVSCIFYDVGECSARTKKSVCGYYRGK